MDNKTIQQIIKEAKERLRLLLEEEAQADIARQKREKEIIKAKTVIDLFTSDLESQSEITPSISSSTSLSSIPVHALEDPRFMYNISETWEERVKAYFKFRNRVLTIAEIVEAFRPYHKDYSEEKLKGAVTNAVAMMNKKKLLKVYDPGFKMRGFYYGNPLWFENGQLKEEYKPDFKEKLLW